MKPIVNVLLVCILINAVLKTQLSNLTNAAFLQSFFEEDSMIRKFLSENEEIVGGLRMLVGFDKKKILIVVALIYESWALKILSLMMHFGYSSQFLSTYLIPILLIVLFIGKERILGYTETSTGNLIRRIRRIIAGRTGNDDFIDNRPRRRNGQFRTYT